MEAIKLCCPTCLQKARAIFEMDFPSDHGLHQALDLSILRSKWGLQFARHTFCVYMLLRSDLPMAFAIAEVVYGRKSPDQSLEDWVKLDIFDTAFFSYLLDAHPWLSDEFSLLLKSMLNEVGLLKLQTCAPDQFFVQWYANKLRACMDLFDAEHHEHPEVPEEPFADFFKFSQNMLKGQIKLRANTKLTQAEC